MESMASLTEDSATTGEEQGGVRRRDFINVAAASFAGVGAVTVVLPLINQMNPSADVLAAASTEVDVSAIAVGQAIKTIFRKQPLFVRHLTPEEIAAAVLYLASQEAAYVTGTTLHVNGGMAMI